jgi:hypothetical protein
MSLASYIDRFRALNVNRARGHASPHKVCMLLAVMDLIKKSVITANKIWFDDALTDKFSHHMEMMGSDSDRFSPYLPFYHLKGEGFWHHEVKPGKASEYESLAQSNSQSRVKDTIAFVYLDQELFDYLNYSVTREQLKSALFENIDETSRDDLRGALSDWSRLECELIARDYLDMLVEELNCRDYSKAKHRRNLRSFLEDRSEGAIEYKHQNISAVLIDLGLPYIRGYKPAFNYQDLLANVVEAQVVLRQIQLLESVDRLIQDVPEKPLEPEWDAVVVAKTELARRDTVQMVREFAPRHYNYAAREGHNKRLGERGEEFILCLEKQRLASFGRGDLVDEIEWTSKTQGDGAGYDIRSFNAQTGQELFIEVKTTNSGKYQPFMISDNEVAFSEEHSDQYSLYRVFQFKDDPRIFTLNGGIREHANLLVLEYTATFK